MGESVKAGCLREGEKRKLASVRQRKRQKEEAEEDFSVPMNESREGLTVGSACGF